MVILTITQTNIHSAVAAWCSDPENATVTYGAISEWDTAGVTDMSSLFMNQVSFNDDLSKWNTAIVTDMNTMFYGASSFAPLDLTGWDVANVTDMGGMFDGASAFNADISCWNVSNVTDMDTMFLGADGFNRDLSSWKVPRIPSLPLQFSSSSSSSLLLAPRWGDVVFVVTDYTPYTNLCFIDTNISSFTGYLNSVTYPVLYNSDTDRESLKTFLLSHFSHIDRVAFVFHGPHDHSSAWFVNNEPYFSPDNQLFLKELFSTLTVQNVDFLPCNLLQQQEWKDYFATFDNNVVVGASLDDTGNLRYGGDWVMENTMQDVQNIYFSAEIENYTGLLAAFAVTFPTYTSPTNINVVTVVLPPTAVSWTYSTDSSGSWTNIATISSPSFTLSTEATYATGAIQVKYRDMSGNYSTPIANTGAITYSLAAPLVAAGYTATQLKTAGYSAVQLGSSGYTIAQIAGGNYTTAQMQAAGFVTSSSSIVSNLSGQTTPIPASGSAFGLDISGTYAYTYVSPDSTYKTNLTNNSSTITKTTSTNNLSGLVIVGDYIYYRNGRYVIGKADLSMNIVNSTFATTPSPSAINQIASDGTNLYITTTLSGTAVVYKCSLTTGGLAVIFCSPNFVANRVYYDSTTYSSDCRPLLYGGYMYLPGPISIWKYNLSGTLIDSSFCVIPYVSNMIVHNSLIYAGQCPGYVDTPSGIAIISMAGKILNPSFFVQRYVQTSISYYVLPFATAIYNDRLYCSTYNAGSIISFPLLSPYISSKPTTTITYPSTIGALTGGSALTSSSGETAVTGTFVVNPALSSTIYNIGTYTDVSATFVPTDTTAYNPISTTILSVTVLQGTPVVSATPTSAYVRPGETLGNLIITGGLCRNTSGTTITGTFTVSTDLSNTVYSSGTYTNVTALFTPTSGNYSAVATTINTVTVSPTAPLVAEGYTATQLKAVGYTAAQLFVAGYTAAQLVGVGYPPAQMQAAGFVTSASSVFAQIGDISDATRQIGAICISGNMMYVGQTSKAYTMDLSNNIISNTALLTTTSGHSMSGIIIVGNYMYYRNGNFNIGKADLSGNVINANFITAAISSAGLTTNGTYIYNIGTGATGGGTLGVYRTSVATGGAATLFYSISSANALYPGATFKPLIVGAYIYVMSASSLQKNNLSTGALVTSNLTNSFLSYVTNMVSYNSSIYIGQNTSSNVPHGIIQIGLDGTIQNNYFFVNPQVTSTSSYTNILDLSVYNNKLYCSTYNNGLNGTVITIPLLTPYLVTYPTATITYPDALGSLTITGGSALTQLSGGTAVAGTFVVNPALISTIYNVGTYIDVSATFVPTDTTNWNPISTKIQSVIVSPGTPYISAQPTTAYVKPTWKLSQMIILGGTSSVPGTYSVSTDLSNTLYDVGTYTNVPAIFTPTSGNYLSVATTILTVYVSLTPPSSTEGFTATQLYTAGYTASELLSSGYNVAQLEVAGYTPAVLNSAGFVTPDMTVVATIGDTSNLVYDFCISGNLMYVGVGTQLKVVDLITNTVTTLYTGTVQIYATIVVGNYIYITTGTQSATGTYIVGKLNLNGTVVNLSFITRVWSKEGITSDGTWFYITYPGTFSGIYRLSVSNGGDVDTAPNSRFVQTDTLYGTTFIGKPLIIGSYIYVYNQTTGYIHKYNLSTGTLVNATFAYVKLNGLTISSGNTQNYQVRMTVYNSSIYVSTTIIVRSSPAQGLVRGIMQIGLDGTIQNSTYFVSPTSSTTFTNIYDMAIYNNKLYCSTYDSFTIISVPLIAPYIFAKPTTVSSITYPAVLGSIAITGGTVKITNSETEVAGTFSLDPTLTNTIYNAGTYTDVSAIFFPTDTINYYNNIRTTIHSVTVSRSTPVVSSQPTSATVVHPGTLGSLVITGGSCTTSGGTALAGTFRVSADLSNSIYFGGTYTNVPAIFVPTDAINYNVVTTTILTVNITGGPSGLAVTFPSSTTTLTDRSTAATVAVTFLPANAATWKYTLNSGSTWTTVSSSSGITTFQLLEDTYAVGAIRLICTDQFGTDSTAVSNSNVIMIDLTGPYGMTVAFPPSTSPSSLTAVVTITNIPVDAVSWSYTVDAGTTWTSHARTSSSSSFVLVDRTYAIQDVQVRCVDAVGNLSASVINSSTIVINYYNGFVPSIVIPTGASPSAPVTVSNISSLDLTDTSVIGTTQVGQRQFTTNSMKSLFSANTAQRQLVLPAGSILPGYTTPPADPIHLFEGSPANPLLTHSKIMGNYFYVLLETGDSVRLQTNLDFVSISRSGSVFTITNKTATVTAVVGDTYEYDGLHVLLGSIVGNLVATTVNFVLTGLNSLIITSTSATISNYSQTFTSDATITLASSVPASVLQNTFYFRTDEAITSDASFVYYYVDVSKWPTASTILSPKNGVVTANGYVASDTVGKDFLRDLARQLFGTYLGSDLFTNEDSIITEMNTSCDEVGNTIVTLLTSIDKTSGVFVDGMSTDSSGNKFLKDNTSTSNISRELFNQLMTVAPGRFGNIILDYATTDGFYRMPILAGDTLTFKLTIHPSAGQVVSVPTGPTVLNPRSYTVILNVS